MTPKQKFEELVTLTRVHFTKKYATNKDPEVQEWFKALSSDLLKCKSFKSLQTIIGGNELFEEFDEVIEKYFSK